MAGDRARLSRGLVVCLALTVLAACAAAPLQTFSLRQPSLAQIEYSPTCSMDRSHCVQGYAGALAGSVGAYPGEPAPVYNIEVVGYVLSPTGDIPDSAVGYAVPIFADKATAGAFCPSFLNQLNIDGALSASTPMIVKSHGESDEIAPFIWPVTSWPDKTPLDCAHLVQNYDLGQAREFLTEARTQIARQGGQPTALADNGPFILTVRRISRSIAVYDLSKAPDIDYAKWLAKAIERMSNPNRDVAVGIIRPNWHDQMRGYVFGAVPTMDALLGKFMPGYAKVKR